MSPGCSLEGLMLKLKLQCFGHLMRRADSLEKTLESPLVCKETQPIHPKGDQSWVFIGRTDVKAETPMLWPPDEKSWLFCDPMECSIPGSSVHEIYQARILEWVAIYFSTQVMFPTQVSNLHLLCLLHWQVDSLSPGKPKTRAYLSPKNLIDTH